MCDRVGCTNAARILHSDTPHASRRESVRCRTHTTASRPQSYDEAIARKRGVKPYTHRQCVSGLSQSPTHVQDRVCGADLAAPGQPAILQPARVVCPLCGGWLVHTQKQELERASSVVA
eukprot:2167791-Prymnesium_polylepis.1